MSPFALDHLRQEIEHGAKASDLLSDPYTQQLARESPELQQLIAEAIRRNGN